ncbi:MAG TPA: DNA-processing protein DprA [Thermoanaerobaculia bacterium]|nr:DNA-processing protein DprA [Thermoanaerobaculia bacterium]
MGRLERRSLLLAWSLLPFLTPARKRVLLGRFDPPELACENGAGEIAALLGIRRADAAIVRNPALLPSLARQVDALTADAIVLGDPGYPSRLEAIADPPLAFFARGRLELASAQSIAVVGSRRASPYGENAARRLASALASRGITVVSGMARGVDAAAHFAALGASPGSTVAVLGTGLDVAYPPEHRELRDRIAAEGLLLTEFAPGSPPRREHFPIRNRIIAGLSLGVVVIEAGEKSGSLITARLAAEEGREVFAVPGSIFSRNTIGSHRLIQDGAKLVGRVEDILEEIAELAELAASPQAPPERRAPVSPELARVLGALSAEDGTAVDAAAAQLGVGVEWLAPRLLALELAGEVRALPGTRYIITAGS